MKIVCITQARVGSTRLPRKVLQRIQNLTLLEIHLSRLAQAQRPDQIVVATSNEPADEEIVELCNSLGATCFRGSERDVQDRFYQAAKAFNADVVVRVTSDCPLVDPRLLDEVVDEFLKKNIDYLSNVHPPTYPDGMDIEVFSFSALERAWAHCGMPYERSHVTPFLSEGSNLYGGDVFKAENYENDKNYADVRLTVDTSSDLKIISKLVETLGIEKTWREYAEFVRENAALFPSVSPDVRNDSYNAEIEMQKDHEKCCAARSFGRSEALLEDVCQLIPLGTQTFSKSRLQFPLGVSPFFASRASGSRMWDIDDNEYVDFSNALLAVLLGHCDPDVTAAVKEQLQLGSLYSLASPLEYEVAQQICSLVPCAEMVRFGKNGSDATAAAVRLARAYTKRDHILCCGYHGWQDWYIGTTSRHLGVPEEVQELTHAFVYNDIASLEKCFTELPGKVAAVILEPVNIEPPRDSFLAEVRELANKHGALLIFDEIITGFRFARGGAQELFGVIPDLATIGKGMANGFPLSAVVGRSDIMKMMETIFFSTTAGGETISLAAAKATLEKIINSDVIEHINDIGAGLISQLRASISEHHLDKVFAVAGYPPWSFFVIEDLPQADRNVVSTLHRQEMLRQGIMMLSTHNISYAHSEADIDILIAAYECFFEKFAWGLSRGRIRELIEGELLEPVFQVR